MVSIIKSIELNNRDNSLNLLRLIFATFVLIGHSFVVMSESNYLPYFINYIILFLPVPCFFLVSGYLITASALKNDLKTFFKKRFARIYPAYFCCILLIVVFFAPIAFILVNGLNFNLNDYLSLNPSPLQFIIYNLPLILLKLNIGNILDIINQNNWNPSTWTLIFEFGSYVSIALIIFLITKLKIKEKWFPKLILLMHIGLILVSFVYPKYDGIGFGIWGTFSRAVYLFSIFLGGSFLYLIKDKLDFSIKKVACSLIFCILVMAFIQPCWAIEISAIPLAYIILFISVTLKSPKFIQNNDISYGVYIYAWPIQCVIACFITIYAISINIWAYIILCWVVTAIFAVCSWFLLEKPILSKVRS